MRMAVFINFWKASRKYLWGLLLNVTYVTFSHLRLKETHYNTQIMYHIAGFFCGVLIFAFFVRQNNLVKINFHWINVHVHTDKSCYNAIIFQPFTRAQRYTPNRPRVAQLAIYLHRRGLVLSYRIAVMFSESSMTCQTKTIYWGEP